MTSIVKRIDKKGKVSYLARVRLRGHPAAVKTFDTKTNAKLWYEQTKREIHEGRYLDKAEAQKHTLTEAVDRFIKEAPHKSLDTANEINSKLLWLKENFGFHLLSGITPALLSTIKQTLGDRKSKNGKKYSGATINRYMSALSSLFQTAIENWSWLESNPCRKIRRNKESTGAGRCLDDEELKRLMKVCKAQSKSNVSVAVILALVTGMRKSEVSYLKRKDVNLKEATIILQDTKNGTPRRIPISEPAFSMLKDLMKVVDIRTDWIFASPISHRTGSPFKIDAPFKELLKEAEIKNFRFHDLRHSCASFLAMSGIDVRTIAEILGHRTLEMAKRYSHLRESYTRDALKKMNRKFLGG